MLHISHCCSYHCVHASVGGRGFAAKQRHELSSLEACNSSQSNIKRQIMSSDDFDALAMPTSDLRHGHWTSSPFWKYRVTNYFSETDSCRNLFLLIDHSKHDDPQEKGRNKNEGIQDYSQAEPGFPSISCRYTSCLGALYN